MKKLNLILISLTFVFFFSNNYSFSSNINFISGKIKVTDGDTIKIGKEKIRLFGIDAPELKQICTGLQGNYLCGKRSKEFLEIFTKESEITCLYSTRDRYKRILGVCYIGGKETLAVKKKFKKLELNSTMVRKGHAVAYIKYSNNYINDEIYAKTNNYGIWKGSFDFPWEWRKKNK